MNDRLHLSTRHRRILEALIRQHLPGIEVWAYGSRVNGRSHDGSDLDMVLRGPALKEIPGEKLADFEEALRESTIPFLVEVRDWARLPERFHREVERHNYVLTPKHSTVNELSPRPQRELGLTPGDGHMSTLDEMCELIVDCPHFTPEWTDHGYLVIRNQNIRNGKLDLREPSFTHEDDYRRRIKRAQPSTGDIVFTREAPMGEVCMLPQDVACCLGQRQVLLRPRKDVDGPYLLYALQSPFVRRQILWNQGTGSTVSNVRIPALKALQIPRLGSGERFAAECLGTLDDKIDLNRRMNETLEAMARAIFKDWFVDFGPTRAKAEGRAPYLAPELWDLFPDALDDEGKPVGWVTQPVNHLFEFNPRETLKKGTRTPYLDMAALPTSGLAPGLPRQRKFKSGSKFRDGDTLFARITPCLENGKTAFVFSLGDAVIGAGSTEFIVIRSKKPLPQAASYLLARDPEFRAHAERSMTGTSGRQRANVAAAGNYEMTTPQTEAPWKALAGLVEPLVNGVVANAQESHTLSETRDLLLPKLMSGEIRLRDAEGVVERVA